MNSGLLKKMLKRNVSAHKPASTNPYLNAKRKWNEHTGGLMHALKLWQLVGLLSLMTSLGCVAGLIYIGSQSKFIPLVFQQDRQGNTLSMTRAEHVPLPKERDYKVAAARFIEHVRMVTADAEIQRRAILQAYSYLTSEDPAAKKANEFLNGKSEVNPFNRATHELVSIEIKSVLQQTPDSWQVDWLETTRNRDGSLKGTPQLMRAMVNLYQSTPSNNTTEIEALRNPHFILVRDFNWSSHL